jgi:orotate phosphoribosyltransferase
VTDLDRLRHLLKERSLRRGDFVLASGARSGYYIDARLTTFSGIGQLVLGRAALVALDDAGWHPAAVGGLTLGADPVACAIAHAAAALGRRIDAFTVRKETKQHGTARLVEGPLVAGSDVVLVEDVVTTGGSALAALAAVREAGAQVLGVLAVVERDEEGRRRLADAGVALRTLITAEELLAG